MPMLNLRHQIKCGRKERTTGAVVSDVDRYYLPQIVQPEGTAPVYQEHGLAREFGHDQSLPDPAFPNLLYLPTIPAAAKPSKIRPVSGRGRVPVLDISRVKTAKQAISDLAIHGLASTNKIYQPNPPAGRKSTRARAPFATQEMSSESSRQLNPDCALKSLSKSPADYKPTRASGTSDHIRLSTVPEKLVTEVEIKKVTKPSRIPVLVRDGKACFNSSPNLGPATANIVNPPRRTHGRQHGNVSGDRMRELDLDNQHKHNGKHGRDQKTKRNGSSHKCNVDQMDKARRPIIEKYTKIFDELVRATAETIAKEKKEALEKMKQKAIEKNTLNAFVNETHT